MNKEKYSTIQILKTDKEKLQKFMEANKIRGMSNYLMSLFNAHIAEKLTTPSGIVGTVQELQQLYNDNKITKKADMQFILDLFIAKEQKK